VMEMLGKANWWLPSWLARVLPAAPRPAGDRAPEPLLKA